MTMQNHILKNFFLVFLTLFTTLSFSALSAQENPQIQVPNIFLNNKTEVEGTATVYISSRADSLHSGTFTVNVGAGCTPPDYPTGSVEMKIDMSDSSITSFTSTTIDEVSSTGKHSPVAFIMGRCKTEPEYTGCHFWIKFANNSDSNDDTPDIVGFLVLDGNGQRLSYGTGPIREGDIYVMPK